MPTSYQRIALARYRSNGGIRTELADSGAHVIQIGAQVPNVAEVIEQLLEHGIRKRDQRLCRPHRIERGAAGDKLIVQSPVRKDRIADRCQAILILLRCEPLVRRRRHEPARRDLCLEPREQRRAVLSQVSNKLEVRIAAGRLLDQRKKIVESLGERRISDERKCDSCWVERGWCSRSLREEIGMGDRVQRFLELRDGGHDVVPQALAKHDEANVSGISPSEHHPATPTPDELVQQAVKYDAERPPGSNARAHARGSERRGRRTRSDDGAGTCFVRHARQLAHISPLDWESLVKCVPMPRGNDDVAPLDASGLRGRHHVPHRSNVTLLGGKDHGRSDLERGCDEAGVERRVLTVDANGLEKNDRSDVLGHATIWLIERTVASAGGGTRQKLTYWQPRSSFLDDRTANYPWPGFTMY